MDFRRILEEARNKKGCAIFETFSSDGPSEFLVVSRTRWDEHQKEAECAEGGTEECAACVAATLVFFNEWKTAASRTGRAAQGDSGDGRISGRCADIRVDIEARRSRGLSKVHHEVRDDKAAIFSSSSTKEKKDHFVASRRRW